MTIGELLSRILTGGDPTSRQDATAQLEALSVQDFPSYVVQLAQELVNEQNSPNIRSAAGVILKNALTAREPARKEEYAARWRGTDPAVRQQIKSATLQTLNSQDGRAGSAAAQVIASIAEIELPNDQWPDLIDQLLANVTSADASVTLRLSTLQAVGYICEAIEPHVLASRANQILTAVAQGARKEEPSDSVRLAAITALYNSLEFVRENFEKEGERNYIMQIVCEATQSQDGQVQVAAFECLVRIMQLYYSKMAIYMTQALYSMTIAGMRHENEKVALQAIEFWSTVCDEEIMLAEEAEEAGLDTIPENPSHHFALAATNDLVTVLLHLLTKKDEDEDEDEWNVSMAAATCLALLASCVQDAIVAPVIPFVETNIRSPDWNYREAAVMAFGSILEGPHPTVLHPLVSSALPVLIGMMQDKNLHVQDTTAWTLGRIAETLPDAINEANLPDLIHAVLTGLASTPRVAAHACWVVINLAEASNPEGEGEQPPYRLAPHFNHLIQTLMQLGVANQTTSDSNFRASIYEAISTLVSHGAQDCTPSVEALAVAVLDQLEQTLGMTAQLVGMDDRRIHAEMLANLCSVVTAVARRLGPQVIPLADRIMQDMMTVFQTAGRSSTVLEDAYLVVSAVITATDAYFLRYMEAFKPHLLAVLHNVEDDQICSIAVGIVGDLGRALNGDLAPYCNDIVQLLLQAASNPAAHRDIKPAILSCFGDIALAINGHFVIYLDYVMQALSQAASLQIPVNTDDYEMIDYTNQLREGIIEAFVGITQGLKTGDKTALFAPHVPGILSFAEVVGTDPMRSEGVTRSLVGLLGDLADAFPPGQLKALFQQPWIESLLKSTRKDSRASPSTREVARWAVENVRRQLTA
ncbi:hypothetical protein CXG81DRAFT_29479 [Caulochytrium protostelioides]|uniref:Importin-95 n=1 Tax=Caulochytrium protostelioides TaxID=1555241 RepID=A0A4P9XBQ3_9FUNG|nr:hypothetical protein CXG81DRAFT_29479 [Caulochytrium protostelioides]|eukprot:RKP02570.1 hypothetical protein CXG81DRAFT_29479 [Caulochytrium protostelioides]